MSRLLVEPVMSGWASPAAGRVPTRGRDPCGTRCSSRSPAANLGELVAAENGDRMLLYRTLGEQNNMAPGDLTRVQAAFAKVRREKAAPGMLIQLETGQWTRK